MCGRFTQKFTWSEVAQAYRLTQTPLNIRPSYNVCPTDPVQVAIRGGSGLFLMPMRWGLIPTWWNKSLKELPATFNARSETVADKPRLFVTLTAPSFGPVHSRRATRTGRRIPDGDLGR